MTPPGTSEVQVGRDALARGACALAESARVVRPGGAVLVAVWGDPEDCEALTL